MPWDPRGYYYRAVRIGGKPTRRYVGGGLLGELAAAQDARRGAQVAQHRQERRRERAELRQVDGQYRALRAFMGALLTAAGYYQHHREWRRMNVKRLVEQYAASAIMPPKAEPDMTAKSGVAAQLATAADGGGDATDLDALVNRLNGPKPTTRDLDALRAVLAQTTADGGGVLTVLDGPATLGAVVDAWTTASASRLVMRADADRMARTLGRDTAPAFERPLIDHIVTCWVRLQLVERDHASNTAGAHNRDSGLYWDRRLSEAQRRYLRALGLLAKLRHLGLAVQVNVANQQVVMNGRGEPD